MTDTTTTVAALTAEEEKLARGLMERAKTEGVQLVGPGGLLSGLTKTVLETALEAELTEDLGYQPHEAAGRNSGNSRNGTRSKTVLTEVGPVHTDVPRDRNGTFQPKIVRKRQRRLTGVDDLVISLAAKGLTTGEVSAHMAEIYGADVSKDTVSRVTVRSRAGDDPEPAAVGVDNGQEAVPLRLERPPALVVRQRTGDREHGVGDHREVQTSDRPQMCGIARELQAEGPGVEERT